MTAKYDSTAETDRNLAVEEWFGWYKGPRPSITLTGADEQTDIPLLARLDAEIGILISMNPQGRNRYPSLEWISEAVPQLPRVAIHLCGGPSRLALLHGGLDHIVRHPHVQRIQINGSFEVGEVEHICQHYEDRTIITQHKEGNERLLWVKAPNHQVLIDQSGGRGIVPEHWSIPRAQGRLAENAPKKAFGFAGGLSATNLKHQLDAMINYNPAMEWFWVDMESSLRFHDEFYIPLATEAADAFRQFMNRTP